MYDYDPYRGSIDQEKNSCFQQAVRFTVGRGLDSIYWMSEQEHYYVVVPNERWAHSVNVTYPKLKAKDVLKNGDKYTITENDKNTFL